MWKFNELRFYKVSEYTLFQKKLSLYEKLQKTIEKLPYGAAHLYLQQ